MHDYTFDMTLFTSVTIEAESEEEAMRILTGVLGECADVLIKESDGSDEVSGECSLINEPMLAQIDGEEVE